MNEAVLLFSARIEVLENYFLFMEVAMRKIIKNVVFVGLMSATVLGGAMSAFAMETEGWSDDCLFLEIKKGDFKICL
ncbi:hypothetical protein AWV79_30300 [Cupriavidus sp. UYMMa02A]|nr:hypothetical protein AWV79_30300 [Cupriavidus sp. UYMMa02A]